MTIHLQLGEASRFDWPQIIQAVASLVAVLVTAAQWWFSHQQNRKANLSRLRSAQIIIGGAYAAMSQQIARLEDGGLVKTPEDVALMASAIVQAGGFEVIETSMRSIDEGALPPESIDAIMTAKAATTSIRNALASLAEHRADMPGTMAHLKKSVASLKLAYEALRSVIPFNMRGGPKPVRWWRRFLPRTAKE